jgi:hypothetical protein
MTKKRKARLVHTAQELFNYAGNKYGHRFVEGLKMPRGDRLYECPTIKVAQRMTDHSAARRMSTNIVKVWPEETRPELIRQEPDKDGKIRMGSTAGDCEDRVLVVRFEWLMRAIRKSRPHSYAVGELWYTEPLNHAVAIVFVENERGEVEARLQDSVRGMGVLRPITDDDKFRFFRLQ